MILAHGSATPGPGAWDAALLLAATATLLVYLSAVRRLRSPGATRPFPVWRALCFGGGLAVVVTALSTPAEHLAVELFAAHMVQHLALAFAAAPLIVLGRPVLVSAVVLGHRGAWVGRPARRLGHRVRVTPWAAALAAGVHVVPWYVWHAPGAYDAALRWEPVHVLEHLTLLASGAALAWLATGRVPVLPALAAVAAGMLTMGLIAAALTFASSPLYQGHAPASWGLTALEDQQLGGALMWFPGSLAYLVAAGALAVRTASGLSRRGTSPAAVGGAARVP